MPLFSRQVRRNYRFPSACFFLLAALLLAVPAWSGTADTGRKPEKTTSATVADQPGNVEGQNAPDPQEGIFAQRGIQVHGQHLLQGDVQDGPGSVDISRIRAEASLSRYSLRWQTSRYSWHDKGALPFGDGQEDPWSTLHALTFVASHRDRLTQRWSYFVQGALRSGFEDQMDRSVGAAVNGGLVYAWNDTWSIGLGGFVGWDPTSKFAFSSTFAMAGPFVRYRSHRAMGLSGVLGFPQSELRYTFTPVWSAWVGLGIDSGTYRLKDDSPVMPQGYVREKYYKAGLYVDITPKRSLLIRFGPTYDFGRRLEFYDSGGGKRRSYDLDAVPGLEARIDWNF